MNTRDAFRNVSVMEADVGDGSTRCTESTSELETVNN